jgi:hypothetical protein
MKTQLPSEPKPYLMISRVVNGWIIHRGDGQGELNDQKERYVATFESEVRQIVKAHCDAECPDVEQPEGADVGCEMPVPTIRGLLKDGLKCPDWIQGDDKAKWEEAAALILKIDNDNVPF